MDNMDKIFVPENIKATRDVISPSGRFVLTIETYTTGKGTWDYSRCIVKRFGNDTIIDDIRRNYSFYYGFFNRDGNEWLWTGKTYTSQYFLNMDTGKGYDSRDTIPDGGYNMCWSQMKANPSGTLFAVLGCVWGGSYDITFYDFSDYTLKEIEVWQLDSNYDMTEMDGSEFRWIDDRTFEFKCLDEYMPYFNKFIHSLTDEEDKIYGDGLNALKENEEDNEITISENRVWYTVIVEKLGRYMHYKSKHSSEDHTTRLRKNDNGIDEWSTVKNNIYVKKLIENIPTIHIGCFKYNGKYRDCTSSDPHFCGELNLTDPTKYLVLKYFDNKRQSVEIENVVDGVIEETFFENFNDAIDFAKKTLQQI